MHRGERYHQQCFVCDARRFEAQCRNVLLRCRECGFVTANAEISERTLREVYSEKYFAGEEYENYVRDKAVFQKNFYARLKKIFSRVPPSQIRSVLEIGCAYGFFGEILKREIPAASYLGFEASKEAASYARENLGLDVREENYLDWKGHRNFTDIFLWDVIEHLERPDKFIEKFSRDTVSGGRLYITTGDVGSWLARWQKCNWRMIHPPSHLHYFSRDTITILLRNKGFTVKEILYAPTSRSLKGIFYSLFMLRKNHPYLVEKVYRVIPENLWLSINTFDIMFVLAEKTDLK